MHNFITFIAKYLVFALPVVWLMVLGRLPKKQRLQFVLFSALSAVIAAVLVKLATHLHQDLRPFVRDHVTPYFQSSTDNGFPSDHTTFSALVALVVLRYKRWWGAALFALAILIGTARVIAGVHHGQDIAGGLVIAAVAVGLVWLIEKAARRLRTPKA